MTKKQTTKLGVTMISMTGIVATAARAGLGALHGVGGFAPARQIAGTPADATFAASDRPYRAR